LGSFQAKLKKNANIVQGNAFKCSLFGIFGNNIQYIWGINRTSGQSKIIHLVLALSHAVVYSVSPSKLISLHFWL